MYDYTMMRLAGIFSRQAQGSGRGRMNCGTSRSRQDEQLAGNFHLT